MAEKLAIERRAWKRDKNFVMAGREMVATCFGRYGGPEFVAEGEAIAELLVEGRALLKAVREYVEADSGLRVEKHHKAKALLEQLARMRHIEV